MNKVETRNGQESSKWTVQVGRGGRCLVDREVDDDLSGDCNCVCRRRGDVRACSLLQAPAIRIALRLPLIAPGACDAAMLQCYNAKSVLKHS
jgi:hypothetical protein